MKYNDTQYYYIKNGQNDIIGILDSNLNQIVSYEYDSWGNIISIKDASGNNITSNTHIGIINPYRYRSYRYDTETGLYYLQSRYYNPEWGRFLNADVLVSTGQGLLCHNMYIYCENNPINREDSTGYIFVILSFMNSINKFIRDIFTITLPKSRIDVEEDIGSTTDIDLAIVSVSTRNTITISSNTKTNVAYSKTDNGKPSLGIEYKIADLTISNEKSLSGRSFSILGKNNGFQYENEYAMIHKISYINFSNKGQMTNSTYYTLSVNHWWTASVLALYYAPELIPVTMTAVRYAR